MADIDLQEAASALDSDDRLTGVFVAQVIDALDEGDNDGVRALVEPLHPADLADLFEQVPAHERAALAAALGDKLDAEVFAEMNDWVKSELLDLLDAGQVAEIAQALDTDDAVAILEDMDAGDAQDVLRAMTPEDRAAIEEALSYPEESAGRLMQRDLVAVPEDWKVAQVTAFLHERPDLQTDFWEIFVVDAAMHPVGTMRLSWLLTTPPTIAVADVMQRDQTLIPVDMDQEEVALRFQKYALISAAVVNAGGRLVGVITVDDIVHIIQEEAGEDILKLSGAGDGDINEPVFDTYRARSKWLIVNLGTAMVSASVIAAFAPTIEKFVVLAALTPIVASVGGNAGTQTMAVAVRALATNQLTEANTRRTIGRELRVAAANGLTVATLMGVGTTLVFQNPMLGGVIAAAMLFNILVAGMAGVIVPVLLDRFNFDPAVSSSVFVTMTTDTMGFLGFLWLATRAGLTG